VKAARSDIGPQSALAPLSWVPPSGGLLWTAAKIVIPTNANCSRKRPFVAGKIVGLKQAERNLPRASGQARTLVQDDAAAFPPDSAGILRWAPWSKAACPA